MISYYTTLLFLTLILQTNKKDVLRTAVTIFVVGTSDYMMESYMSYGYSIFQSAIRCEVVYLILLVATLPLHKSKMLFFVTITSLSWNILCIVPTPIYLQDFIYISYETLNIILFECLLYSCVNTTRVSMFMKRYLNDMITRRPLCRKGEEPLC